MVCIKYNEMVDMTVLISIYLAARDNVLFFHPHNLFRIFDRMKANETLVMPP